MNSIRFAMRYLRHHFNADSHELCLRHVAEAVSCVSAEMGKRSHFLHCNCLPQPNATNRASENHPLRRFLHLTNVLLKDDSLSKKIIICKSGWEAKITLTAYILPFFIEPQKEFYIIGPIRLSHTRASERTVKKGYVEACARNVYCMCALSVSQ